MVRQNVYDDEGFFTGYQQLRATRSGLNEALEQPALRALLPDVVGARVVDLGCGDGSLARALTEAGAASVLGVDPSARMLALARARTEDPRVRYEQLFAEDLRLPDASVDLVVSSLALHYIQDLAGLLVRIASWLRPGGSLVASMEHPVVTAAPGRSSEDGWVVADYAEEGVRHTRWYTDDVIKFHRTTGTVVGALLQAGLVLTALDEPAPTPAAVKERVDLQVHRDRPALLLVRAERP
ncbi:class I SAM-dependent methyltransferase [Cellulomonas xiejunii]|uniref:Class I SAM-dependent methyltransferase n=1 Tax=Cellulomonas xiejunii TaxID=2968083 RepID=A0ABY5KSY3_9CELL|nr:class I SAM-dependent methyltransferase [Cellulomonas xiejunii]MCC2322283.1 class I SAM-dependent methyltransferase [Cellulomonas xiejunii]UUI72337.1 class I SAM-dependent methyltransferase [Cellulomonas xiejunii]